MEILIVIARVISNVIRVMVMWTVIVTYSLIPLKPDNILNNYNNNNIIIIIIIII